MGRTIGEQVERNFLRPLGAQPRLVPLSPTNNNLRINVTGTLASRVFLILHEPRRMDFHAD